MSLKSRIKKLNSIKKENGESVVYIMSRDQRVKDNHALIAAQKHAISKQIPLLVYFILYPQVKHRVKNQFEWMLSGLQGIEKKLAKLHIPFTILTGSATEQYKYIEENNDPNAIYFDFSPLKGPTLAKNSFAKNANTPCYVVDTHNVVPVWVASDKEEIGARTLRGKIIRKLNYYLQEPEELKVQNSNVSNSKNDFEILLHSIHAKELQNYNPVVKSGEEEALRSLKIFIEKKLKDYAELRNDPANNFLSDLSAYFHFGQLPTLRVALEIKKAFPDEFSFPGSKQQDGTLNKSIESYLEEMIVRKELSDNYCYYNKDYDNLNGAKEWARTTLNEHKKDKRMYIYSYEELENASTHDSAWNAAQNQMKKTGKMHGYMRMYWAKKILEWTTDPETALKFAIKLNDTYELDGYDPNGYVGCMWSIAGVHDRGWTEREIFGKIRFMNFNGLKRKFDIDTYIKNWQ